MQCSFHSPVNCYLLAHYLKLFSLKRAVLLTAFLATIFHSNLAVSQAVDVRMQFILDEALNSSAVSIGPEGGNCSGSLIQFDQTTDDQKALVLTNGHCIDMGRISLEGFRYPDVGEVISNVLVTVPVRSNKNAYVADQLVVGTMSGFDSPFISYQRLMKM